MILKSSKQIRYIYMNPVTARKLDQKRKLCNTINLVQSKET